MQQILDRIKDTDAFDNLTADTPLELEDGTFVQIPPHPDLGLLGDEGMDAYDDLQHELRFYDREDDEVIQLERKRPDGTIITPARTRKGPLKFPHEKDGELVKPSHRVRVVKAALGEDTYAQLRAGGRKAADVWKIWVSQAAKLQATMDSP